LQRLGLSNECKKIEPRAKKKTILLVERWAKQRGVCTSGGVDLTPFVWILLAVSFLQVGVPHRPLLPPLQGLKTINGHFKFSASGDTTQWKAPVGGQASTMSVGGLFKTFKFYAERVDWHNDVIPNRLGLRQAPTPNLPGPVIINADGSSLVGPCIEDPFDPSQNLTAGVTSRCMPRLHEELQRSMQILRNRGSVSELLAPLQPLSRACVSCDAGAGTRKNSSI